MIYRIFFAGLSACLVGAFSGCCCMHHTPACPPTTAFSVTQPTSVAVSQPACAAALSTTYTAQYSAAQSVTVGAYDNSFQPATITVSPGTTVQWVSYGRDTHTVTSDDRLWDSGDIRPGSSYAATFAQPGTYYYHCCHHRQEMRGTIIVSPSGAAAPAGSHGGQMSGY
jgi:plastocyanin